MHHLIRLSLAVVSFPIVYLVAEGAGTPASDMAHGARHYLGALTPGERQRSSFGMQDEERLNWHYIPRERKGVPFGEMTPAQRKLGHALLASGLSRRGYVQASEIMFLEQILREKEGGAAHRDADAYFFSVFGDATTSGTWGWRLEGHHLSVNFTIREGKVVSSTPLFFGANPGRVLQGGNAHMETLAQEEALARRLVQLFEGVKRSRVIIDVEAPADILTKGLRKASMGDPEGVSMSEMNPRQKDVLTDLLHLYAHRVRPELAQQKLQQARQGGEAGLYFAWAGGTARGQPHYYRIQGPGFVIEYDNTQNNANHIHTVWRSFEGDFGLDALKKHYALSHGFQARK